MNDAASLYADLGGGGLDRVRDVLVEASAAAAAMSLPLFRTELAVDNKYTSGFDPVTEADRGAEAAIREVIAHHFPDHAIIGEEMAVKQTGSRFAWIIDPIDGTRAFISGVPVWGTLIGFTIDGKSVAGLMNQPFTGETFMAVPGRSIYQHKGAEKPLKVSGRTELASARLFTTNPRLFGTEPQKAAWAVLENGALQSRYGCDCYAYCMVAAGHADLVVETGLKTYDIAALIPIIEEAGGAVSNWEGGRAEAGGEIVAASSRELLDTALQIISAAGN